MISVVILTRNEERDLPDCLASVGWSNDVHVFDSFSNDQTLDVARIYGAKVAQRQFDGYASQRNAALSELKLRHPWVLFLDADERIPRTAAEEMRCFVASPGEHVAARLRRRDHFMGRWLKHAQMSPYIVRLMCRDKARYRREVNEVLDVQGAIHPLHEPFDHYPFSKGIAHWLERHNRYSTLEAREVMRREAEFWPSVKGALIERDFNRRRACQKALFYRLPFRPVVKFAYLMFLRGAILDGRAGITYATLQMFYEYMIVVKTGELQRAKSAKESRPVESTTSVPSSVPANPS